MKLILLFCIVVILSACSNIKNHKVVLPLVTIKGDTATVVVTLKLDANSEFFEDRVLKLSLYSYSPMIADVPASLIDSKIFKVNYTRDSKPFSMIKNIGENKKLDKKLKYYISVDIVNNKGKRTHFGYKNGTNGFSKVLKSSRDILMIIKQVKK